jgi:hypothetical protein
MKRLGNFDITDTAITDAGYLDLVNHTPTMRKVNHAPSTRKP